MGYRITKHAECDYHVEQRGWFGWNILHSTPGFPSEQKARDFVRRFTNPEVVAAFDDSGNDILASQQAVERAGDD